MQSLLATLWIISSSASAATDPRVTEAQFLTALRAVELGAFDEAITLYQGILSEDPTLVRVRLELARAYFLNAQWGLSRAEFFRVLSGDLPDPVRQTVLAFIREIDARRGFEWNLEFGAKTLGATRDYDTDDITLDFGGNLLPATLERSDETTVGLGFSASALWRGNVLQSTESDMQRVGFAELFTLGDLSDDETFRDITAGARAGWRVVFPEATGIVGLSLRTRFLADDHFEDQIGLDVSFETRSANAVALFAAAQGALIENREDDNFSGHSGNLRLGARRSFAGRATLGAALFAEIKRNDSTIDTFTSTGLEIFGSVDLGSGLIAEPAAFVAQKDFRDTNPLFTGDPDEDQFGLRMRLEKRDLILADGFVPFAEFEYNRVKSGIDAFSYDERIFSFGFTRAF